jgi:hypothetical protein
MHNFFYYIIFEKYRVDVGKISLLTKESRSKSKSIRREVGFMQHIREHKIGSYYANGINTGKKKFVGKDFYTKLLK